MKLQVCILGAMLLFFSASFALGLGDKALRRQFCRREEDPCAPQFTSGSLALGTFMIVEDKGPYN